MTRLKDRANHGTEPSWPAIASGPQRREAAMMMATAMQKKGVRVSSSVNLPTPGVVHNPSLGTFAYNHMRRTGDKTPIKGYVENVRDICGDQAIVLMYDYNQSVHGGSEQTYSRMVCRDPEQEGDVIKCQREVPVNGGIHFRHDSLIAHWSVMDGYGPPGAEYRLPPGRHAPSMYTDNSINGRVYCYASLRSVPKEGDGKSLVMPMAAEAEQMAAISPKVRCMLSLGIVTILKCCGMKSGPGAGSSLAQWAKMGFNPQNGCVIGCILTNTFMLSVETTFGDGLESTEYRDLAKILENPASYLDPDYQDHLKRYVAGGALHAYAPRIPSWCAGQPIKDAREYLEHQLEIWAPDGSTRNRVCADVVRTLTDWLDDGIKRNRKLYSYNHQHYTHKQSMDWPTTLGNSSKAWDENEPVPSATLMTFQRACQSLTQSVWGPLQEHHSPSRPDSSSMEKTATCAMAAASSSMDTTATSSMADAPGHEVK